jgi:hypothetical protein
MTSARDRNTLTALTVIFALSSTEERIERAVALAAPEAHPDIRNLFHQQAADIRKAMSRADCQHEGGWDETTQIGKEKSGALRTFLDGKKRLVSVDSFYECLITRVVLSHPLGAPAPKGTQTSTRFKSREEVETASAT